MAAVDGFRYDVFVSYAHADNLPVAGGQTGLVSQLVADLKTEIGRKVGKALEIWWDHYSLAGNDKVTPEIMGAAGDSAAIVVIVSPAYLRSEWCGRERDTFFEVLGHRDGGASRGVFVVSLEPTEQDKLPPALRDFRGYEFYRALDDGHTTRPLRPDITSDKETYYNRLSQLVQNVADHLAHPRPLSTRPASGPPPSVTTGPGPAAAAPDGWRDASRPAAAAERSKPSVLLLEVTDDLVQRRADLKDYLEQAGIGVLPEKRYSRDDMVLHRQQMVADLARSQACVQILGPLSGDRSDHPRGMAWLRYETIRDAGSAAPFLQWRDPDLNVDAVTDADARDLLAPASVRTDRFPDFRRAVGDLASKPAASPTVPSNVRSVFVNADLLDRELAGHVTKWLEAHGFMVLEPPQSTVDAREEWETNVRYCDSLLLVYGQSKPTWVKTQILLSNKVSRETPLKVLGICVGPPRLDPQNDKAAALSLRYAGIHFLRNEDSPQLNQTEMERFAQKVQELQAHA